MNTLIDIGDVLPAIRVPTLLLHRAGDLDANIEEGRYIAKRIPGARFVELTGADHLIYAGDQDAIIEEVKSFIRAIPRDSETESVLATVLYAEIVKHGATAEAIFGAESDRFYGLAKREANWFKGKPSKAAPGRFLATFDGPARAIRCACAISDSAQRAGIQVRIGIHTGLCDQFAETLGGVAVETSASIAALAAPFEVLVSNSVKDLVSGAGLHFEERHRSNFGAGTDGSQLHAVRCDRRSTG